MAQCYLSDTSVSLEHTAESISILNLAEHSEVSISIPHGDASTLHTMVSLLLIARVGRMFMICMKASYRSCDIQHSTRAVSQSQSVAKQQSAGISTSHR
jgi:hypothetical protein